MGAVQPAVGIGTWSGSVLSFRDLAREQLPRLLSLARRLVGNDAEDVVQDCLLKAYQKFDQLHDPQRHRRG